jgi:hypothetical protein
VVRGGSYLTSEGAMRTSIRHEIPFYVNNKLRKSKTTGFRVVMTASVLTSLDAIQNYRSAWQKLGKNIPKSSGSGNFDAKALDNPVNELIAISKAVTNENMKKGCKISSRCSEEVSRQKQNKPTELLEQRYGWVIFYVKGLVRMLLP